VGTKIILLSDGTGSSAARIWRTNVWRFFEALDVSRADHKVFYDDGIGSATFKPFAIIAGMFGYGLKRNVRDLYKFVCRNCHSEDDEIFGPGFSRGAFTIKVATDLITHQGLAQYESEAELDWKARAAYRAYRNAKFHSALRIENFIHWIIGATQCLPVCSNTRRVRRAIPLFEGDQIGAAEGCGAILQRFVRGIRTVLM
jgi:uncharacterized protein (DUF2235 family)